MSNDFKVKMITLPENECALVLYLLESPISYLVKSPERDLMWVIKHGGGFVIYKLVWFSNNPRWEEVMSLDDVSLFLGDHHSISITASNFARCSPNSIYFCQRCRFLNPLDGSVYVFSLNDKTVVICYMFTQL